MQLIALPDALDIEYYRNQHADLKGFSDGELLRHYTEHGIKEGRVPSLAAWRGALINIVQQESSILEVGPFATPAVSGDHVRYIDAFDTAELMRRCAWHNLDTSKVPHIDYVSSDGSFGMIDRKFSAVFGSHSIEHQHDLVRHLQNVSSVLEPHGRYYIVSPDKRFCFDHFRSTSTLADVLTAYLTNLGHHQPRALVAHAIETTHNDPARHWAGDHGVPSYRGTLSARLDELRQRIESEEYIDCHAWQFTPESFFEIVSVLNKQGLVDLVPERVYHTPRNMFEFTVVLRKEGPVDGVVFLPEVSAPAPARSEPMPRRAEGSLSLAKRIASRVQHMVGRRVVPSH